MKSDKGGELIALSLFPLPFYAEVRLRIRRPGFTRRAWSKRLPICIPRGSFIGTSSQKTSFWIIEVTPNWWVSAMFGAAKKMRWDEMRSGPGCCHPPPRCFPSLPQTEAQGTTEPGNTNSALKFRSVALNWKCLEKSIRRNPPGCFGAMERLKDNIKYCLQILVGEGEDLHLWALDATDGKNFAGCCFCVRPFVWAIKKVVLHGNINHDPVVARDDYY